MHVPLVDHRLESRELGLITGCLSAIVTAMESATTHLAFDRQLVADVCERLSIRSLVLFGSWASGSPPPTAESDVDHSRFRWQFGHASLTSG